MATLVVAGLGAAIGYGATGTAVGLSIGWSVGSYLGGVLFPTQLPDVEGPRVTDLSASTSAYGVPKARIFGTIGVPGNMIWSDELTEIRNAEESGGGKGGGGSSQTVISYTYTVTCAWALTEGPVSSVRRIWFDSELVYDRRNGNAGISTKDGVNFRIYLGGENQLPDPEIEAIEGVGSTPAYRGTCYIVVQDLPLADYGNRRPNVRAEVVREGASDNFAEKFADEAVFSSGIDKSLGWYYTYNGTNAVRIYDAYSGTLITTWQPQSDSSPGPYDQIANSAAHNGFVYGYGWYDGNNNYVAAYDMATGARVWRSESNAGGLGVGSDTIQAHDQWLLTAGILSDTHCTLWEYNADGSLYLVLETNDVAADEGEFQLSVVEPDTGYIWILYDWGSGTGYEQGLQLLRPFINTYHFYSYTTNKWLVIQEEIGLNDAFDASGNYTGSGVKADNFYLVSSYYFQYDPLTQSVMIEHSNDDGGTAIAEGLYRIECTTRHVITTARIAAHLPAASFAASTGNHFMNVDNPLRGDGSGFYFSGGASVGMMEFRTEDFSLIEQHTWPIGQVPNLVGKITADWAGGVIYGTVISNGQYKLFWDRQTADGMGLDDVVSEICLAHDLDASEIDVTDLASKTVKGFAIARPAKARTQIEVLMGAYHFDAVESDKKLKFQLKGKSSIVTIPQDDLAAREPGQALPEDLILKRKELYQIPATIQVTYISRELEYEPSNQYARQPTSPTADILKLEFPLVMDDDEAAQVAAVWLQAMRSERHTGSITIGPYYFEYDPTDIITVTRNNISYQFRLAKTGFGGLPGLIKADVHTYDAAAYVSDAIGAPAINVGTGTLNQAPITVFYQINSPPLRDSDDDGGFYAAFSSYNDPGNWDGGILQRRDASNDESSWVTINSHRQRSIVGTDNGTSPLPAGKHTVWDWVNSINVDVWNGDALASDSELDVLNGLNMMYFPQSGELMQFQVATLEGDGTYTLTGLLRGRRGTDYAMDDHILSEPVVLLDPTKIYKIDDIVSNVGRTFTYSTPGFKRDRTRSRNENWTQLGGFITPLSPVSLEVVREADDDFLCSWIRRARLQAEWLDNVDVPLDEPTEEYDIELYQDTTLLRTVRIIGANSYTYTAADQMTDNNGELVYNFNFCVYQISSRVGRGRGACLSGVYLETAATDFDEYNLLEQPINWTEEGNTGFAEWLIQDEGAGDHSLESTRTSAGHNFLNWGKVSLERDAEVLVKTRTQLNTTTGGTGTKSAHGVILRAAEANDHGILVGFWGDTGTAMVGHYTGTPTYTSQYAHPTKKMGTNTWWWIRARVQGDVVSVKYWADGGSEPGEWDHEYTQTEFPDAGRYMLAGAYEYWGGPEDFDFFSVAYNGATAPNVA